MEVGVRALLTVMKLLKNFQPRKWLFGRNKIRINFDIWECHAYNCTAVIYRYFYVLPLSAVNLKKKINLTVI